MRLSSFNYLVKQGTRNIWKNGLLSFASFCIMTISLLLVGVSVISAININKIIDSIESKNELVIFIRDGATERQMAEIGDEVRKIDNIATCDFVSREQVLEEEKSKNSDDMKYLLQYTSNPYPDLYRISIKNIEQMDATVNALNAIDNIEKISAPSDFVDTLVKIKATTAIIATVVIATLFIISMVIISNATRSSVFARRKEINIMKYVGASNTFIKVPFFIEGMIIGLLAAIMSFVITYFIYDGLINMLTISDLFENMLGSNAILEFKDIALKVFAGYAIIGIVTGAIGTVFSTNKHLKV